MINLRRFTVTAIVLGIEMCSLSVRCQLKWILWPRSQKRIHAAFMSGPAHKGHWEWHLMQVCWVKF